MSGLRVLGRSVLVGSLLAGGLMALLGTGAASAAVGFTPGLFRSVTPARVLDTRTGLGAHAPGANSAIAVQLESRGGLPAAGVTAVVLNVTVAAPTTAGFVVVYPDGTARPATSNLNFVRGQTVPNLVTVPVGADGKVDLYNHSPAPVQLIGDISGYYTDAAADQAGTYVPLTPTRLLDTRAKFGGSAPGAGGTVNLAVAGRGGVPAAGVSAVVLNLTVTAPTSAGFVTAYPYGARVRPGTSNINFIRGQTVPNLVTVAFGTGGKVSLYNGSRGTTQLLADVQGYYLSGAPTAAGAFVPKAPTRLMDTRLTQGAARPGPGGTARLLVEDVANLPPTGISAVVINVTVTEPTEAGFVTAYAYGTTKPGTSNLNFVKGQTVANLAVASVGTDGKVDFYNGSRGSTQLIGDVAGYFSSLDDPWTWSERTLPTATDTGGVDAISCASTGNCVAVGQYTPNDGSGAIDPLIETLSNGSWTPTYPALPSGEQEEFLNGVSCPSSDACVAVGYAQGADSSYVPVVVTLAAGTWTTATDLPLPAGADPSYGAQLQAVSCPASGTCTLVGQYADTTSGSPQAFVAALSGGTWTATTIPAPAGSSQPWLNGISCVTATDCVAVGSYADTSNNFDGWVVSETASSWSTSAITPPVSPLAGVSCTSTSDCVAVGNNDTVVTLSGGTWTASNPSLGVGTYGFQLMNVSCISATACTVVGGYQTQQSAGDLLAMVVTLSGGTWTMLPLAQPVYGELELNGVSCTSATACWASGLVQHPGVGVVPITASRS